MTYLVFYEGLMMTPRDQPILDGYRLVQTLGMQDRVLVATDESEARVAHQLRTERIDTVVAEILDDSLDLPPLPLWQRQIEVARSKYLVKTVVTARPEIVLYAIEHGMMTLYFAHPSYSGPAIRPQVGNRTWEQLVEELEARP